MARQVIPYRVMEVFLLLSLLSPLLFHCLCSVNAASVSPSFDAIYNFGDSISDTGNKIVEYPAGAGCGKAPYGDTFFHHPTGRCSDGLLIIDFFAQAFQLPLLSPYLKKDGDFTHGANFAVSGATALDVSALAAKHITAQATNSSLSVQLGWFKSHLNSICATPSDCQQKLENALFLMGEIGGNDYNAAAFQGKPMEELRALVPDVVQAIVDAVKEMIDLGAKRIILPGNFPVGCMTIYLAAFKTNDPTMYDELKCLKSWNDLAAFHNGQLVNAIKDLRKEHVDVAIVYADYFSAMRSILQNAPALGFDKDQLYKACCGSGDGDYNFNAAQMCGSDGVPVCPDVDKRISWDGIHLTQHTYHLMADWLLKRVIPPLL